MAVSNIMNSALWSIRPS